MGCLGRLAMLFALPLVAVTFVAGIGQLILSWRHRPGR